LLQQLKKAISNINEDNWSLGEPNLECAESDVAHQGKYTDMEKVDMLLTHVSVFLIALCCRMHVRVGEFRVRCRSCFEIIKINVTD